MVGPTPRDVLLWWPHVPGRLHCILGKVVVILFLFSVFFCAYTNTNNFGIFASLQDSSSSCCPILNNWEEEWERWGRSAFFCFVRGTRKICVGFVDSHSSLYFFCTSFVHLPGLLNVQAFNKLTCHLLFPHFICRGGGYGLQHSFSFMSHSEGLQVD